MRKFITFGPALVVLLTAVVTLVAAPAAVRMVSYAGTQAAVEQARVALGQDTVLKQIDRAVREVARAVEPSVVHIGVNVTPMGRGRGMIPASQGSGWVFDGAGHVVTNAHVVRNARNIAVTFQDGRVVDAELVGQDPTTDIAVIKVTSTEGLFPIDRATGESLEQGDRVYAFGSPFGFKFSMSEGIVSALNRDPENVIGTGGYTNFIQTDAAVNPGNSGGPLVNVEGRLVGMNVAIATARNSAGDSEGQNSGISFAIPLETIERVVGQVITTGKVTKGYLGVGYSITDEANQRLIDGLKIRARGVLLTNIEREGPAEAAGLRVGDVITRINERAMTGVAVFRSMITNIPPGETVNVEVLRDGEPKEIKVTLAEFKWITPIEQREAMTAFQNFGILGVAPTGNGRLVVTEMLRGSPAMRQGIRPGMAIITAEGREVADQNDLLEAVGRQLAQGRTVKITVSDDTGTEREVELDPRP